jgi:hypothetical protein
MEDSDMRVYMGGVRIEYEFSGSESLDEALREWCPLGLGHSSHEVRARRRVMRYIQTPTELLFVWEGIPIHQRSRLQIAQDLQVRAREWEVELPSE